MSLLAFRTRLAIFDLPPNFRWLWLASLISRLGDWLAYIAINLYVLNLTHSATALGGLLAMQAIPMLVVSPLAGALVDRLRRRHVMLVTNLMLALLYGLIPLTTSLWQIYLLMFLARVAFCFFNPAQRSLLPDLVNSTEIIPANAALSMVNTFTLIAGAGAGGLLVAAFGTTLAFELNALSFLLAAICIAQIRGELAHIASAQPATTHWFHDVLAGLRYARGDVVLRVLLINNFVVAIAASALITIEIIYIKDVLHGGDTGYGLMYSIAGIGALVASLIVAPLTRRFSISGVYVVSVLLIGLIYFPYANVPVLWFVLVVVLLHTIPWVLAMMLVDSMVQSWAPQEVRGRVFSLLNAQQGAGQILVALIFAPLTDLWGVRTVLNISGVIYTLIGIYAVTSLSVLRQVDEHRPRETGSQ